MARYANNEIQGFAFVTTEGDESGPAYYPVSATWKGSAITGLVSVTTEWNAIAGYEAKIRLVVRNGSLSQIADMRKSGISVKEE